MRIYYLLEKLPQDELVEFDELMSGENGNNNVVKRLEDEKKKVRQLEIVIENHEQIEKRLQEELKNGIIHY